VRLSKSLLASEVRARRPASVVVPGLSLLAKGSALIFAVMFSDVLGLGFLCYGLAYILVACTVVAGRKSGWYAAISLCLFDAAFAVAMLIRPEIIAGPLATMLFVLNVVPPLLCMPMLLTRRVRDWFRLAHEVRQALRNGIDLISSACSPSSSVSSDSAC